MWDPRNYVDADFGLGEDESYEPLENAEPDIDISRQPHVMTVLGPIAPEDLGICLPVEHVLIDPPGSSGDHRLNDPLRAIEELTNIVTAGGKSIVDATTFAQGRDLVGLFDIARRVPVHILCSTSTELGTDRMLAELRDGVGPRRIRPGVIQSGNDEASLDAAHEVAANTGVPIFVHLSTADGVRLPSGSIVILNCDSADEGSISKLIDSGNRVALVGIDSTDSAAETKLAKILVNLASAGCGDRLLISQGLDRRSRLHSWGGQPGLVYLLERFTLQLMEAGAEATLVRQLLIENPMYALTIHPNCSG